MSKENSSLKKLSQAKLQWDEEILVLERKGASVGAGAFVTSELLAKSGQTSLDWGFANTSACESAITYIDGDAGVLRYRGYPIEQLARYSNFLEVAYLLIFGELPTSSELEQFDMRIREHRLLHEDFKAFFYAFPHNGHPMAILQAGVAGLATYHQNTLDADDPKQLEQATLLLLAKMPTMISSIAKRAAGLPVIYPNVHFGYTEDFLRLTFGMPYQDHNIDPMLIRALDMLLILHADHEQNCSTSTVRLVGSSKANLYTSIASGIGALAGALHGGANEAVLRMLRQIQASDITPKEFIEQVKQKQNSIRLMGFGHRVYKNYDPRAAIVKQSAHEILSRLGRVNQLLDLAMELEEKALNDDYFIERKLYPNVDFYTGIIYAAMGFTTKMFTPLFALGRLPGWIAHYWEMVNDPRTRIGRPRQLYVGEGYREYEERG